MILLIKGICMSILTERELRNALFALNTTITEMIEETGVDVFSFGGTKAGAMFGEMVIFR